MGTDSNGFLADLVEYAHAFDLKVDPVGVVDGDASQTHVLYLHVFALTALLLWLAITIDCKLRER